MEILCNRLSPNNMSAWRQAHNTHTEQVGTTTNVEAKKRSTRTVSFDISAPKERIHQKEMVCMDCNIISGSSVLSFPHNIGAC